MMGMRLSDEQAVEMDRSGCQAKLVGRLRPSQVRQFRAWNAHRMRQGNLTTRQIAQIMRISEASVRGLLEAIPPTLPRVYFHEDDD
jgi:hypothetical protein